MTFFVRKVIVALLCFECIIFFVIYYAGPVGVSSCNNIAEQILAVEAKIKNVEFEIVQLSGDIKRSDTSFMQEKIAREVLQMKKVNETVYIVKKDLYDGTSS